MGNYRMIMDSPIGHISLVSDGMHLKSATFTDEHAGEPGCLPDILVKAALQLQEYFDGKRTIFDLPLDPDGTEFQKKVWKKLLEVPYGKTKSYGDIARELGSVLNTRAVGTANGRNPVAIIIPCHRIIGQDGKLVGYAGGLERKKWLLLHESGHTKGDTLF